MDNKQCMYTTQGDLVCAPPAKERFVDERPNAAPASKSNTNPIVNNALQQNYCDITVSSNPATGAVTYSMKKDCQK